jgi:hypothetical protein
MKQEFARQVTPFFQELQSRWSALEARGMTTETSMKLTFSYTIPKETPARALAAMLQTQFSYQVEIEVPESAEAWQLQGSTSETTLTIDILKKWIAYMVQRGVEAGGRFESWGASVVVSDR